MLSKSWKTVVKPRTLLAGAFVLAVMGSCISCLNEKDDPTGVDVTGKPPGEQPPGNNTNTTSSGNGDPNTVGQPPYVGLYGSTVGFHAYIWPDGTFVAEAPRWDQSGVFDAERTKSYYRRELWGQLDGVAKNSSETSFDVTMTFASGHTEKASIYRNRSGVWVFSGYTWFQGLYIVQTVERVQPANVSTVSGTFVRQWDVSQVDNPNPDMYGVDIHASGYTIFDFKPGNRVYFKNSSQIVTTTTVGTSTGGSVNAGDYTDFNKTNVEGEGAYVIDGYRMRITFDNGDVLEDLFHLLGRNAVFGNAYAQRKN
jgi:hypothetical protein